MGNGEIEVIHTPGHTFGSICLRYGRDLFTGDHVLAKTSPNIGGGDMRRRGLLKHFMESLDRMIDLAPQIDTVYPGHGEPFRELAPRCRVLARHHRQRIEQIKTVLEKNGGLTVYELACQVFGKLKDYHVILGCAEAQSHLEVMTDEGTVIFEDGKYRLP